MFVQGVPVVTGQGIASTNAGASPPQVENTAPPSTVVPEPTGNLEDGLAFRGQLHIPSKRCSKVFIISFLEAPRCHL